MSTTRGPAFILSNIVGGPTVFVDAGGTEPATMPAANLQNEEPSEVARILTLYPNATRWSFAGLASSTFAIGGLALVNSNLSPGGYYRFTADNAATASFQAAAPDARVGSATNVTGGVTNIDEGTSLPDASFVGPTTTTSQWIDTYSFPTMGGAIRQGTASAVFVLWVVLIGTPTNTYPKITVQLRESGALVASLGWRAVTDAVGQFLIFPFDPALLAAPTAANIEVRVIGDPGSNGSYAKLDALDLFTESSPSVVAFDSGWLPSPLSGSDGSDSDDGPQPTQTLAYWPTTEWTNVNAVDIYFLDDQAQHDPPLAASTQAVLAVGLSTPLGYLEAGVATAGPALFLGSVPLSQTPAGLPIVEELSGTTIIGHSYSADAFRQRTLTVNLRLTRDELITIQDRIVFRRGRSGAFFFAAEPDIPAARQVFNSGWFTLVSMSEPVQDPVAYDGGDGTLLFTTTLELEEKL